MDQKVRNSEVIQIFKDAFTYYNKTENISEYKSISKSYEEIYKMFPDKINQLEINCPDGTWYRWDDGTYKLNEFAYGFKEDWINEN